jgi:hypothetical protein
MKKLTDDEVLTMLQTKLIYQRTPENLRPILMTSVMDLAEEIQQELEHRNEKEEG